MNVGKYLDKTEGYKWGSKTKEVRSTSKLHMLETFLKVCFTAVLTEYIIKENINRHCTNLQ